MVGRDMLFLLKKRKKLSERSARFYLAEVLLAIETLHEVSTVRVNPLDKSHDKGVEKEKVLFLINSASTEFVSFSVLYFFTTHQITF
jgi:hypothetical protein